MKRCALVSAVLLLAARTASAHPEHCAQSLFVEVEADRVTIAVELNPGSSVARSLVDHIDSNRDRAIDAREQDHYSAQLARELSAVIDGVALDVRCAPRSFSSPGVLETGAASLTVRCAAKSPALAAGSHELSVRSDHRPVASAYSIHVFTGAGGPRVTGVRRALEGREAHVRFALDPPNLQWNRRARALASACGLLSLGLLGGWLRRRSRASILAR